MDRLSVWSADGSLLRRFAYPIRFYPGRLSSAFDGSAYMLHPVPVRCVWIAQESNREEFLMSVALDAEDARPPSRLLLLMEGRAFHEFLAFRASLPLLRLAPSGDGHPVLVLPGLVASDISTRPLRGFLRDKGYAAHGWKLGRNNGYFHGLEQRILDRIHDLRGRYGAKISLIG